MSREEVFEKIKNIVEGQLYSEYNILEETDFHSDLGFDSIDDIETIMEVEKEFDISIDEGLNRISDFKTLDDMAKWLLSFNAA